jgi:hypothetical protein
MARRRPPAQREARAHRPGPSHRRPHRQVDDPWKKRRPVRRRRFHDQFMSDEGSGREISRQQTLHRARDPRRDLAIRCPQAGPDPGQWNPLGDRAPERDGDVARARWHPLAAVHGRDQLTQNWGFSEEDGAENPAEEFGPITQGSITGGPIATTDPETNGKCRHRVRR